MPQPGDVVFWRRSKPKSASGWGMAVQVDGETVEIAPFPGMGSASNRIRRPAGDVIVVTEADSFRQGLEAELLQRVRAGVETTPG